ncbi:protein of unknown function [Agreia bicolorata]|uniref:Protein-glutamine gamma-glutamyltransferase-like C-terminal domain-containing protein n=1 Tax=Agreia bicolorata TaxID=110935 RepID=A0A1T4XW83_9MICO|nr:DUF4129 domain-containing protein [Agreia bicolorata]SKA93829.1 protein of unknown function [Agreia bicolorata]
MLSIFALPVLLVTDVPVDPDAPGARKLLLDELAKPEYAAAKPTLIDRIAQAIQDWLGSFRAPEDGSVPDLFPLVVTVLIIGLIVAAFFVFGRPRLRRKSQAAGALFSDADDPRTSTQLRASAHAAAAAGDFVTAIEEMFRAVARQLAERTVVSVTPGTTAQEFAVRAARAFPEHGDRLARGARAFDGVRYLDQPGTREGFDEIAALDRDISSARPSRLERVADQGATL